MTRRFKPGDRVRVVGGRHDCSTGTIVLTYDSYGPVELLLLDTTHATYPFAPASTAGRVPAGRALFVEHIDDTSWSPYP